MAGMTKGLAPNMVVTGLDAVFFSKFNERPMPQMATPMDPELFVQDTASNSAVNTEIMNDGGLWDSRTELQDVSETSVVAGQPRTFTVAAFAQALPISKHYFDDEEWGTVKESVRKMALKGRLTDYKQAFAIYRNAFAGTLTNDGAALISDSHTNLNGDTVDNKLTAALAEDSLNDAINLLVEQVDQSGDNVGHEARTLFVPNKLYKKAIEITEAELRSETADNDPNVYSTKYGIIVKQSNWIGASNGGSDTAWFLLAKDHTVTRWKRQEIVTDIIDYKYQPNNTYIYKAEYRNVYGAISYEGIVGSDGTT